MVYRYSVRQTNQIGDILLLTLAPKHSVRRLQFRAGQYAALSFRRHGRPTPARCFSIVSTPASGVLQFAMRVEGNFTQTAARLQPGDGVMVQGPFGEFTVDPAYDRRVVLLASGIGITPCISIISDLTERREATPITLWYSNKDARLIPFYEELQLLTRQNPNLQLRFFSGTKLPTEDPRHTTGKIDTVATTRLLAHEKGGTFFICGSANFTSRVSDALKNGGVHETRIISESFTQSTSLRLQSGLRTSMLTYGLAAALLVVATGGIMAMDISRSAARHQTATTSQTTTSTSGSDSSTATNTSSSSTSSDTSETTPTTTTTTPESTYTYQSPVSSMS